MAISNLRLNVTANTARALSDFNKFSRSLDNKFLISGLKLDVVRNALGQINRDFQRAIGEQGLNSATSLRAAQNQAALLTQTFKGFASESALAITKNIGTALNNVALRAGGTMKDVQKTLAATPFISTRLSEDVRRNLAEGILTFQRDLRRGGVGDNFAGIAQQFLTGQTTGLDLMNTGGAVESFLGQEIIKRTGGQGYAYSPEARSQVLADILNDPEIQKQLSEMAKKAAGFRIILEDLNTRLFNTETGVFGSLRKVIDRAGKSTTMFDEVYKLVDQVFGPEGMFRKLFRSIAEIFGIGDPMRPFIDAIQFVTGVFKNLTDYFNSTDFRGILFIVKDTFYRVKEFFVGIYESPEFKETLNTIKSVFIQIRRLFNEIVNSTEFKNLVSLVQDTFKGVLRIFNDLFREINSGTFNPEYIVEEIRKIGENIREYIKQIGKRIRGEDIELESGFVGNIAVTILEEIGKTAILLFKEIFVTLIDKVPEIANQVLPAINRGINTLMQELFGNFAGLAKIVMATMPGPVGAVARASMITDATGGQGTLGLLGAAAPFMLGGIGGLGGAAGRLVSGTGRGATAFRGLGAGFLGADPMTSLALGFAPQILWGIGRGVSSLNATRVGFMNSPLAAYMSSYGGSAANRLRSAGGFLSSRAANVGANISGYLGAVGPLGRTISGRAASGLASAQNQLSLAQGFIRNQRSQFMAGFRPPFPNLAIGAGSTRAYQFGQFVRNFPSNSRAVLNRSVNTLRTGISSARSASISAIQNTGLNALRSSRDFGSRALQYTRSIPGTARRSLVDPAVTFLSRQRSQFMSGFRPPFPNVAVGAGTTRAAQLGRFVGNLPGSLFTLGSEAAKKSSEAVKSISRSTVNLSKGLLDMGSEALRKSSSAVSSISRSTVRLSSSLIGMGSEAFNKASSAATNIGRSTVRLSNGLLNIGSEAFKRASSAANGLGRSTVRLSNGLLNIGSEAFKTASSSVGSISRGTVRLSNSLLSIGSEAFKTASSSVVNISRSVARLSGSVLSMGVEVVKSSSVAIANITKSVLRLSSSILAIGLETLKSSAAAIGNIAKSTTRIAASLLAMGIETLKSAGLLVAKIVTTTGKIAASMFSMGVSILTSGQQLSKNINITKAAVAAAAGGAIVLAGQAVGQKVGGDKGEMISDVTSILGTVLTAAAAGAQLGALRGSIGGPKGAVIGAVLGGIVSAIGALTTDTIKNNGTDNNYEGKNYFGPALALESRMSGRRPMVVNEGEFVIPKDGFATLAGIVGENIRYSSVNRPGPGDPTQVNVALTLNVNSVVANPDELATVLKEPVYKIMYDAWVEARDATRVQRARVS